MTKRISILLILIALILCGTPVAFADGIGAVDPVDGISTNGIRVNAAEVFDIHCAGCHINGGNIIRRGKTLKQRALRRNNVDSLDAVVQLVTHGKNNMSAYQDRLTPEEIQAVSVYVLDQAKRNWH